MLLGRLGRTGVCGHWGENVMPDEDILDEDESKRGGGPKTPGGKERASRNSTTHGMRSKKVLILADETAEEYEETREGWLAEYEPEGYQQVRLVEQLILNDWLLKRANRRVLQTEAALVGDEDNWHPADWVAEQEHKLELMQRYKTTAERAFYRSLSAVEHLRKDILRERILNSKLLDKNSELAKETEQQSKKIAELEKENRELKPAIDPTSKTGKAAGKVPVPLTKAQMTFQGQKSPKKRRKIAILDQWVEIEVSPGGRTVTTTCYPSNEILIANGQKMWPPPEMVYRRLFFPNGVPNEYAWTARHDFIREIGGMGIQRMTVDTWLDLIEEEKKLGTGHLLPCGNLPRPEERGGCECEMCLENRGVLERLAGRGAKG